MLHARIHRTAKMYVPIRIDAQFICEYEFRKSSQLGNFKYHTEEDGWRVSGWRKSSGTIGKDHLGIPCEELEKFLVAADAILKAMEREDANNTVQLSAWVDSKNGYADFELIDVLEKWTLANPHLCCTGHVNAIAHYIEIGQPTEFTYCDGTSSEDHKIPFAACF